MAQRSSEVLVRICTKRWVAGLVLKNDCVTETAPILGRHDLRGLTLATLKEVCRRRGLRLEIVSIDGELVQPELPLET